jgi:hypothetical protein
MPLSWLHRFATRTHWLLLPGLVLVVMGLCFGAVAVFTEGGRMREFTSTRQLGGTLVLFTVLPGYLVAMLTLQWRRTDAASQALAPIVPVELLLPVRQRLARLHSGGLAVVVAGVLFGASQNLFFFEWLMGGASLNLMDYAFVLGACAVWGLIALLLAWRIPVSLALSRAGAAARLDLYRLEQLQPLARVATTDVLVVAGAMALMPLQSLDAEFRLDNYWPGILVGVPAAIVLFLLPLWGPHRNIQARKAQRLRALRQDLDAVPRERLAELETMLAHIDRVRSIPGWPIDVRLVTRIIGYVIIPPLAWVGAALVENLVDRL